MTSPLLISLKSLHSDLFEISLCTNFSAMASLSKFVCIFTLILMIKPMFSQQSYDKSNCTSEPQLPGSNYICNPKKLPCQTYIVYRAQHNFRTLSSISSLFNANISELFTTNNMVEANSSNLRPGQEIIIPVTCSCPDRFSEAMFIYNCSHSDSLLIIACTVFEGLVKAQSLIEENPDFGGDNPGDLTIKVPVRCACLAKFERDNGVRYLVTYPVIQGDSTDLMARKFGVPEEMIRAANKLDRYAAIYPQTTLLIPTKDVPVVNWEIDSLYENPPPSPQEAVPFRKVKHGAEPNNKNSHLLLGFGIFIVIVLMVVASGGSIFFWKRYHQRFQPSVARSSQLSNLSPDFLDGMSKLKHSLMSFSLEELRNATEDFGKASIIGRAVYQGKIRGSIMAIKQMDSEEVARHVIEILTRINHVNMVKLEGCCYGTRPYLVFEFAENGSLRDCLSNPKIARQLTWKKRMQIAFDLAVGLHYIHYCTKPGYVHRNINSRSVLITMDWRAKISGFRMARALLYSEEERETEIINESVIVGKKGYLAPEYLSRGLVTTKMDIYAFGVVLLELISAKEAITKENFLKDSAKFLIDGGLEGSSECLEKLKKFTDPVLQGDYPLSDALCLALLAKCCTEEEPHQRPTINDLLKALSRIL